MRQLTQVFVRHPVVVIAYSVYALLWFLFIRASIIIEKTQTAMHPGKGYCATGLMAGFVLMSLISAIYLLATAALGIFGREKKFYGVMVVLIILTAITAVLCGIS